MKIAFDSAKDAINVEKHGISLAEAERAQWNDALVWSDLRRNYGEDRLIALVPIGDRLHCVVFVERDDELRVISLRKANQREFDRYESETKAD